MNHFMNLLILLFMLTCFSYGNISHMVHELAHGNADFSQYRDVAYAYDQLNWLTKADDAEQDYFDEIFAYDPQGRIVAQRRDTSIAKNIGDEYAYYANTNRLKSIANGMGGSADSRSMSDPDNFVYDTDDNLIEDKSKSMRISYDWRGMPSSFTRELEGGDSLRLELLYDGSGRRISKTRWSKANGAQDWEKELVTHYTGIGTEVRENLTGASSETKVVVNMPQNLGRYGVEYADAPSAATTYAWFLHDHLGSTVAVYGSSENGEGQLDLEHAYEYRSFGEMAELASSADKVTENFTGKELDDETQFTYHGARYLDPMLGMWISVDLARFFTSPYLYMGNGYNPIRFVDLKGKAPGDPFGSAEEAAQDFARLYNGLSIASNKEYGTIFYRKGDSYSYVNPTRGRASSVNLSACVFEARTKGYQIVSSGHTHGRLTDEYGVKQEGFLEPSNDDYISEFTDENYTPYKENPLDPAYVVVPNGDLLKYDLDGVDVVPTEGIASDPIYQYDVDFLPEP